MTDSDPYEKSARWYDALIEPLNGGLRAIGMKLWPLEPGSHVLDVGCGTGSHLRLYRDAGCEVHGADPSPAMLAEAQAKLGRAADLRQASAVELPFDAGCFDLVLFSLMLHEISPAIRSQALAEACRVATPETGRILVIDYHTGPYDLPKGWALRALIRTIEYAAGEEHHRNFREFVAGGGAVGLARRHGLEVDRQRIVGGGNLALLVLRPTPRDRS